MKAAERPQGRAALGEMVPMIARLEGATKNLPLPTLVGNIAFPKKVPLTRLGREGGGKGDNLIKGRASKPAVIHPPVKEDKLLFCFKGLTLERYGKRGGGGRRGYKCPLEGQMIKRGESDFTTSAFAKAEYHILPLCQKAANAKPAFY